MHFCGLSTPQFSINLLPADDSLPLLLIVLPPVATGMAIVAVVRVTTRPFGSSYYYPFTRLTCCALPDVTT